MHFSTTVGWLFGVLVLVPSGASASEWFCTESAAERMGAVVRTCGVGEATTESQARMQALKHAKAEFHMICDESADCRGRATILRPLRNQCEKASGQYRCYRGLEYTIQARQDRRGYKSSEKELEREIETLRERVRTKRREQRKQQEIVALQEQLETDNLAPASPRPDFYVDVFLNGLTQTLSDTQVGMAVGLGFGAEYPMLDWLRVRGAVFATTSGEDEESFEKSTGVGGSMSLPVRFGRYVFIEPGVSLGYGKIEADYAGYSTYTTYDPFTGMPVETPYWDEGTVSLEYVQANALANIGVDIPSFESPALGFNMDVRISLGLAMPVYTDIDADTRPSFSFQLGTVFGVL